MKRYLKEGFDDSFEENEEDYTDLFSNNDIEEEEKMLLKYCSVGIDDMNVRRILGKERVQSSFDPTACGNDILKTKCVTLSGYSELKLGYIYRESQKDTSDDLSDYTNPIAKKCKLAWKDGINCNFDSFPVTFKYNINELSDTNPKHLDININPFRNKGIKSGTIKNFKGLPDIVGHIRIDIETGRDSESSYIMQVESYEGIPQHIYASIEVEADCNSKTGFFKDISTCIFENPCKYSTELFNVSTYYKDNKKVEIGKGFGLNSFNIEQKTREEDHQSYGYSLSDSGKKGDKYITFDEIKCKPHISISRDITKDYKTFKNLYVNILKYINSSNLNPGESIYIKYNISTEDFPSECYVYKVENKNVLCINKIYCTGNGNALYSEVRRSGPDDKVYSAGPSMYKHAYILEGDNLVEVRPNFKEDKLYPYTDKGSKEFVDESFDYVLDRHEQIISNVKKIYESFDNSFDDNNVDDYSEVMSDSDTEALQEHIKEFACKVVHTYTGTWRGGSGQSIRLSDVFKGNPALENVGLMYRGNVASRKQDISKTAEHHAEKGYYIEFDVRFIDDKKELAQIGNPGEDPTRLTFKCEDGTIFTNEFTGPADTQSYNEVCNKMFLNFQPYVEQGIIDTLNKIIKGEIK